mgnify:FL=1
MTTKRFLRDRTKKKTTFGEDGQCDNKIHKKREETKKREKEVSFFYHIQKSFSLVDV